LKWIKSKFAGSFLEKLYHALFWLFFEEVSLCERFWGGGIICLGKTYYKRSKK